MNSLEKKRISRDISGPASSVLFALLLAGSAITKTELAATWTNLSAPTVQAGLDRLSEYGLVTHHGKHAGWQVNLNQLRLWQGHDGIFLSEKATSSTSGSYVASPLTEDSSLLSDDPITAVIEDRKKFTIPLRSDQIRSDLNQSSLSTSSLKDQSDLISIIEFFGIEKPAKPKLLKADVAPQSLYGWLLWSNCQDWVKAPLGWAIKCTLKPSDPKKEWLSLASWLLSLTEEERANIEHEFIGRPVISHHETSAAIWQATEQEIDESHSDLIFQLIKAGHKSALWRI